MQLSDLSVGYVLKKFPRLSETFIINELLELERIGIKLVIFSLKNPYDYEASSVSHKYLKQLKSQVIYLPNKKVLNKSKVKVLVPGDDTIKEHKLENVLDDTNNEMNHNYICASAIASFCKGNNINHLHSHFGTASNVTMLASDLANISFSFTTHAKDIYKNDVEHSALERRIRKSDFVVTVSDYNKKYLGKRFKKYDSKIIRLYNGLDLKRFNNERNKVNDNIILAVGRLEKKKGFHYLIESLSILKDSSASFKCIIVGDGSERENLNSLICKHDLSMHVELLGARSQEQVIELLSKSKVFVLPSIIDESGDRDVLPTVLIEAMAMKVPAISTTISAIPEIIENNHSGILIEQKNPQKLAGSLKKLLVNDELQQKFAKNGIKRVQRLFDIEKNVPKLAQLFSQAMKNRKNKIAI